MEEHQKEIEGISQKRSENAKRLQEMRAKLGDAAKSGSGDMEELKKALAKLEMEAEEIRKQDDEMQNKEKVSNVNYYFHNKPLFESHRIYNVVPIIR